MKVLILYTELAGYTVSSIEALAHFKNVTVHLVRWPVNKEAPFSFSFPKNIHAYNRNDFDAKQLIGLADKIQPDIILCSGWIDKGYLSVCKHWKDKIPVVMSMDNKWRGTARQYFARLISRFTLRRYFTHAWVPGKEQLLYAEMLGFARANIKTGFYTCDTDRFIRIHSEATDRKAAAFPHVFVYAGRYFDFKGVEDLWNAFIRFKQENSNDWKLVCLGIGDIKPVDHPDISHEGFVQPDKLDEVMRRTGVFVLPSRIEPWGVVVQEFAAAGFPLLLSDAVGAGETFLRNGENGFLFKCNNEESLLVAIKTITERSDAQLLQMGNRSSELAAVINPHRWAETLLSFLDNR